MDPQRPVNELQVEQAARSITPDLKAQIKARMGLKPKTEAALLPDAPFSEKAGDGALANAEVRQTLETGKPPAFPAATVAAAVRAADVLLPQALEQRVLMIAGMYLNNTPADTIAKKLGLDVELVTREIHKIDHARSITYNKNPELAEKVVQQEYNVVEKTIETINDVRELRGMLLEEMRMDYQEGLDAYHGRTNGPKHQDDEDEDPETGKKKPKRRPSISPMKADTFAKLVEVEGKQLDRLTDVFGLVKKHIPDNAQVQQINNFLNVDTDRLNRLADQLLIASGNHLPSAAVTSDAQNTTVEVVDAEVVDET